MSNEIKDDKIGCIYGISMFLVLFGFIGFVIYLLYVLISKASSGEFTDITLLQAMLTAVFSVLGGTLLSKKLEERNAKSSELFKIRSNIGLKIIDLGGLILCSNEIAEINKAVNLLINENVKVKIFFDDEVVKAINYFLEKKSPSAYEAMTDKLKKYLN